MTQRHEFSAAATEAGSVAVPHLVGVLQFSSADERRIVQMRPEGYSFNRLAPYGSLHEYLPDIEWSWGERDRRVKSCPGNQLELD